MKKLFSSMFLFAVLSAGSVFASDMVFIDIQKAFKMYYKTQMAQEQLMQQADDVKFEAEAMGGEVQKIKDEVEVLRTDSRDETLSDEARRAKRNLLEEKLVELQKKEKEKNEFQKLRMEQLEQQNSRMTRKLFDEIKEVIIVYSKEKGFDGMIDRSALSANGSSIIFYVNPKRDVTGDVLAILNEGHEDSVKQDSEVEGE